MHHATTRGFVPVRRGFPPRALALWLLLGSFSLGLTQVGGVAAAADAEPRVARVAFAEGQTSYLNADADEWTAVDVNAPLVTGDRFYSGSDGRAEIQLPAGVYARLASDTELELLEVSNQAVQVKVGIGTATFRVREVPAGQHVEFSTPTTAVVARSRGAYRVDVADDGQTTVTVREGEADAYVGDERYRLDRGRGARIVDANYVTDDVPPIEVFDASTVRNDPWDDWEAQRASRVQSAASYQYVDQDVYGAEDLDEYGTWDRHETYGPIWRPTSVAVGWTPYTQGRWVWQDPWGWTWVDYQPWGWAPSHYGRWVNVQSAWAWAPGPVVAQPAYAPATVGFLGVSVNTPSVSVSVGIGPSVGWVPLGWGEPIVPWWGGVYGARVGQPWWGGWGGPRIVNNNVVKNITNVNVTNINYTNIDRGFTAVSRDSFVRGDMQRLDMPRERMRDAFRPLRGAPDVIPARESLFAARPERLRGGRGLKPSQEILQRAAVSTRDVPAARPDFGRKLKLIERDKGAPVAPQQLRQMAREGQQRADATPRVRTVAAKGRKPVVPEVTAQAPERLNGPMARTARPGSQQDQRAARRDDANGQPQRGPQQRNDGRADTRAQDEASRNAALGERRMPQPGSDAPRPDDPRRAAREEATGRQGRVQQPAQPGQQERATAPSRDEAQRQRVESAQQQRQQREQMRAERAQPGATDPRNARRAEPSDQPREQQTERAKRNAAERAEIDRARAATERGRSQRDGAQPQAERASRDQAETRQAEQARRESAQRQQTERAQRDDAERQQAQRTERAQAERAQQEGARRQQAEQAQRDGAQRQQAEQARRETQQREQAKSARRDAEARQEQAAQAERSRQAGEARQRQADAQRQREAVQAQREQASQRQAAERQQAERQQAQRQQAERQQAQRQQTERQQAQRQQAERQQAQRQQQQRSAERQGQGEDPRSAQRPDKKQQQRRAMPDG